MYDTITPLKPAPGQGKMMQDGRKWCSPKESSVVDKKLVQLCHIFMQDGNIFMQDMKKLMQGDKKLMQDVKKLMQGNKKLMQGVLKPSKFIYVMQILEVFFKLRLI